MLLPLGLESGCIRYCCLKLLDHKLQFGNILLYIIFYYRYLRKGLI